MGCNIFGGFDCRRSYGPCDPFGPCDPRRRARGPYAPYRPYPGRRPRRGPYIRPYPIDRSSGFPRWFR